MRAVRPFPPLALRGRGGRFVSGTGHCLRQVEGQRFITTNTYFSPADVPDTGKGVRPLYSQSNTPDVRPCIYLMSLPMTLLSISNLSAQN